MNRYFFCACAVVILNFSALFPNVLIITHSYNRPDFIEIQNKTFKKMILGLVACFKKVFSTMAILECLMR